MNPLKDPFTNNINIFIVPNRTVFYSERMFYNHCSLLRVQVSKLDLHDFFFFFFFFFAFHCYFIKTPQLICPIYKKIENI